MAHDKYEDFFDGIFRRILIDSGVSVPNLYRLNDSSAKPSNPTLRDNRLGLFGIQDITPISTLPIKSSQDINLVLGSSQISLKAVQPQNEGVDPILGDYTLLIHKLVLNNTLIMYNES